MLEFFVCLELDEHANIISYEEYHPFGTTSYRSGRSLTETSLKRYKYVGKERDEETGLYYYGARYYAAWFCRFVSVDPIQFEYPELTPYQYASNRPVTMIDLDGLEGVARDINYMPEAEEFKYEKMPHKTAIKFAEITAGSGQGKAGVKLNYTIGIATDDAGVTHFSMFTTHSPSKETHNNWVWGSSIGGDIGYKTDVRATFRQTLKGDSISQSTHLPSIKFSLGIGFTIGKYGESISIGPSAGLLVDYTYSRIKESVSLTSSEAKNTHTKDGLFWTVTNARFDKTIMKYTADLVVKDLKGNIFPSKVKLYSFDKKVWESKSYSENAGEIESENNEVENKNKLKQEKIRKIQRLTH